MARLPDQIGKYNVIDRIGKGGMGVVFKARHPTLDRFVILKKLTASGDRVMRERFRREAEIMIDFRTDYVVDVYDHFRDGKSDYIALEFIDGDSLDEILVRERYLSDAVSLLIIRDCCLGLDYVHGKGVVHRDVKPGNVLVGRDGSVKLLDFGIASRSDSFDDELTRDGMTLGTVAYIAPEQIEQSRTADLRADIYSTGAMLYEMVTGRKAFAGGFTPENVNRIQRGRYRAPRRANPQVSRFTARLIRRCMRRNPKRRISSAGAIVSAIDRHVKRKDLEGIRERIASLADQDGSATEKGRPPKRRWLRVVASVIAAIAIAAAVAYGTGYFQRYLLRESHSLVHYQIKMRRTASESRPYTVRLVLERVNSTSRERVTPLLPLLHPVAALETPDYITLRSRLLTLRAGSYRSTARIGETIIHDEVSLAPLERNLLVQPIEVIYDPEAANIITLAVEPYNALTREPIQDADVEAEIDGSWTDLTPASAPGAVGADANGEQTVAVSDLRAVLERLRSPSRAEQVPPEPEFTPGETIRLRITHNDYETAVTEFQTEPLDRFAIARIGMTPSGTEMEE